MANVVTLQDDVILYKAGDSTGNQLGHYRIMQTRGKRAIIEP